VLHEGLEEHDRESEEERDRQHQRRDGADSSPARDEEERQRGGGRVPEQEQEPVGIGQRNGVDDSVQPATHQRQERDRDRAAADEDATQAHALSPVEHEKRDERRHNRPGVHPPPPNRADPRDVALMAQLERRDDQRVETGRHAVDDQESTPPRDRRQRASAASAVGLEDREGGGA
jgi:hypothetical protein